MPVKLLTPEARQPERANDTYDMVPDGSPLKRSAELQVALNLEQLDRKDAAIVFDPATETIDIVVRRNLRQLPE